MICPFCQTQLKEGASFCSKCGKRIPYCPTCGTLISHPGRFCPNDGSPLPANVVALFEGSSQPAAPVRQTSEEPARQDAPSGDAVFQPYFDHTEEDQPLADPGQNWGTSYGTPRGDLYPEEPEPLKKKNRTRTLLIVVLVVLVVVLFACLAILVPRLVPSLGGSAGEEESSELQAESVEEDVPEQSLVPEEETDLAEESGEEGNPEEEGTGEEPVRETYSLILNSLFLSLKVGDTWPMSVTVQPADAELIWSSDDSTVAAVDGDGLVTAVGAGDCTISVRLAEDDSYTGRCTVTVYAPEEEQTAEGEYSETDQKILDVISAASVRNLTEADLEGFDADMCKKVRNGIYAVHGRMFTTQELTEYFSQFDWYEPTIPANEFDGSQLNAYELYNASFLSDYEKEHGFNQ